MGDFLLPGQSIFGNFSFYGFKESSTLCTRSQALTQLWFCTSAPVSFTLFSSQRPRVFHAIPLMLVPTSLEHRAQTPSLEVISLSTPYKRLLCPKSTHTHTHTVMWIRIVSTSCSLTTPSHRPSALSPRKPLALFSILFRGHCKPPLHILHPQSMTSPSALHSPSFLSFPFQEKAYSLHLLRNLAPLIILSLV